MLETEKPSKNKTGGKCDGGRLAGGRLLAYLKPVMGLLILMFVFETAAVLADLFVPGVIADMVDYTSKNFGAGFDMTWLFKLAAVAFGLYLTSGVMFFLGDFVSAHVSQSVVYRLRRDIKAKLDKLPLAYYDKNQKGDILSRINNDTDTIATTIKDSLTQIIWASMSVISVLVIMFVQNVWLTLITIATVPLFALVGWFFMRRARKLFVKQQRELGKLNGHIEEMYGGHSVVKLYGLEARSAAKFEVINGRLMRASGLAQSVSGMLMPVLQFIGNVAFIGVAVVGAMLAGGEVGFAETISVGMIIAFIQYRSKFTQPINNVANIANVIQSTLAAAERVFELLDEREETQSVGELSGAQAVPGDKGAYIEFKDVSFSYSPDKPLIRNLSFGVPRGGNIAIVGPTGAGKTTLVNLLMRFYDVTDGQITIDGRDIRDYNRGDLRALFGMVLQDAWLFSGTIAENIAYGDTDATRAEIEDAARSAHVHHFICTLGDGYDTVLNEDSGNISQGQRQLITIARAILKKPKILILDEATSSVDTRTEESIQNAMTDMMEGKTCFVIAHRLSTVKNASLILVMNGGQVVETGTHAELLTKGGAYSEMYYSL